MGLLKLLVVAVNEAIVAATRRVNETSINGCQIRNYNEETKVTLRGVAIFIFYVSTYKNFSLLCIVFYGQK